MSYEFRYSKAGQRELSDFLAREMLFDYIEGRLDPERTKAMQDWLKKHPELTPQERQYKQAIEYCKKLSEIKVAASVLDSYRVKLKKPIRQHPFLQYRRWPTTLKWGLQAAFVGLIVALIFKQTVDWIRLTPGEINVNGPIIISEMRAPPKEERISQDAPAEIAQKAVTSPTLMVEAKTSPIAVVQTSSPAPALRATEPSPVPTLKVAAVIPGSPKPVPSNVMVAENPKAPDVVEEARASDTGEKLGAVTQLTGTGTGDGYVYRMFMRTRDVKEYTPRIVADITRLGGVKAGAVELGWKKDAGSYFHFTLKEDEHDRLVKELRRYGSFTIQKDRHLRVMPIGIGRYILQVDPEKKAGAE